MSEIDQLRAGVKILQAQIKRLDDFLSETGIVSWKHGATWQAEQTIKDLRDEVARLRVACSEFEAAYVGEREARQAAEAKVQAVEALADEQWLDPVNYREPVASVLRTIQNRLTALADVPAEPEVRQPTYPAGHGYTPHTGPFATPDGRCRVTLARSPCYFARGEHDPALPPEDIDAFGYRRRSAAEVPAEVTPPAGQRAEDGA